MADYDNLFDEAMARADTTIRGVMGAEAKITSGSLSGVTLRGVFDDPENIGFAEAGIRIDGTRPTFFCELIGCKRAGTFGHAEGKRA